MSLSTARLLCILVIVLAFPFRSPAPFIYTPGEGWTYEPVGGEGKWKQTTAKDQLEVAQAAFDKQAYGLALKAARRVTAVWPLSDYAPQAQYLLARCYEIQGNDEKAFKAYQKVLERYPKISNYNEIVTRQFEIANKYLAGKWFRVLWYVPLYPSMSRTADMYEKVVQNGPFSDVAPKAQLNIGTANEKRKTLGFKTPDYAAAASAYEKAADRYHDRPQIASDALYREGLAHHKQSQTAEYDQTSAGRAIDRFTDFITLYPNDPRADEAQRLISALRLEQARGNFEIARFYESKKKWNGALVYYNEVVLKDPESPYASEARKRVEKLKQRVQPSTN
jgi:outer membrane protein assembly factor BamD